MNFEERLKQRALRSAIKSFAPKIKEVLEDLIAKKQEIELQENEIDLAVVIFEINNKVFLSVTTIDQNRTMVRPIYTKEIDIDNIDDLIKLI